MAGFNLIQNIEKNVSFPQYSLIVLHVKRMYLRYLANGM